MYGSNRCAGAAGKDFQRNAPAWPTGRVIAGSVCDCNDTSVGNLASAYFRDAASADAYLCERLKTGGSARNAPGGIGATNARSQLLQRSGC